MAAASPPNPPATDASGGPPKTPRTAPTPDEEIKAVARKFADQPLHNTDPGVWAVLTAISKKARQRQQGMNIILNGDEHRIGRLVEETRFQIRDIAVSANHCKISRVTVTSGDNDSCVSVFLKDTSTNGTFHNWTKLRKGSPESRLQHGDIISLVSPPHEDHAYAFVYREVSNAPCSINGSTLKRKAEDCGTESKRSKGIGIGSADGPISLDDVRSLQRSNMDLRKQLEAQDLTIETLRGENRSFVAKHEIELKELKESMSSSFDSEIKEMQLMLDIRQKKLDEMKTMSSGLQGSIKDLNERLAALTQSRADADEIIQSQKTRILELETQLDEERNQRREERENTAADLKSSMQRVQAEAQEDLKRQADKYIRESKEQSDLIAKYQDSEKESRELVDALRSKLEDSRENLIISEKKVRQLEAQVLEEKTASENCSKTLEAAELEMEKLKKELELEKVAREEAWAKVSALELEIAAAMHELSVEKQRFQGARERIILRETQLRAFYSTTEEISALFAKQQEQLKAMQKTLEDEENCENLSIGFDLNACPKENAKGTVHNGVEISVYRENPRGVPCGNPKNVRSGAVSSSDDDDSMTEKHDCDVDSQEEGSDTQDMGYNSVGMSNKGFGSDINCCGTAPVHDGDPVETEQVQETESPVTARDEHKNALHRCSNLAGQTQMQTQTQQVDEEAETHIKNTFEKHDTDTLGEIGHLGSQLRLEGAETSGIGTADLLASEVPGSWVNCTAPSNHGENDSPLCTDAAANGQTEDAVAATPFLSGGQAEVSQNACAVPGVARLTEEHRALNTMIGIVAPELKQQFQTGYEKNESLSDAETEEGSNQNGGDSGGSDNDEDSSSFNADNGVMIQDSAG